MESPVSASPTPPSNDALAKAVNTASVAVPIVVTLIAAFFSIASAYVQTSANAAAAKQATDAKLLDLAVGILRDQPKPDTIDIREWAADLLDKRSPDLPLPASVRAQLKTIALPGQSAVLFPAVDLSASPDVIRLGQSARLSWNSANANTVNISPGIGSVPGSGYVDVSPKVTTTYTIVAVSPTGGSSTASVTVGVR